MIELASFISAPLGAMMLGDLGADVLKIEPPRGDPMRRLGRHPSGISPMFVNSNRGKRSATYDLKQPEAQRAVRELLAGADLLVCNWRASVADRLGLADDVLVQSNPRLIRLYVTGFGPSGPLADSPVYDTIIQARLGLTEANGDGTTPALDSSFMVDKVAGMMVCQAALAALVARGRTGTGDRVDLAMLDAAAYANFPDIMVNRTFARHEPPSARNLHPGSVRPIATKDGWIVVVPVTSDQVRRTLAAAGRPDLADAVIKISDGVELTRRLYRELDALLASKPTATWLDAFAAHDVPAAPCQTIDEHLADPQTVHNDLYRVVDWPEWPDAGPMRHVRYPATFSSSGPLHPRSGPPRLGPVDPAT